MLNLQSLKEALSSVADVGKGEITFEVNGIPMTLRILAPDEQIEVQRYAAHVFEGKTDEDGDTDQATSLEFMATFQIGLISHALIAMQDQDFRNESVIDTGEKLPNGVAVTLPRYQAIRNMIRELWSRDLRVAVFRKYGELVERVEKEAEKAIEFTPTDYDSEIKRLEEQIELLQDRKARDQETLRDTLGVKDLLSVEQRRYVEPTPQEEPPPHEEEPEVSEREPFFPPVASPPQGTPNALPVTEEDSFFDPSDADAIQEANRRMAEARLRIQKGQAPQAPDSALNAIHRGEIPNPSQTQRVPPHAQAASLSQDFDLPQIDSLRQAQVVGHIGGHEVYRPAVPQVIQETPVQARQVPFVAPKSSVNPNFRPAKK